MKMENDDDDLQRWKNFEHRSSFGKVTSVLSQEIGWEDRL